MPINLSMEYKDEYLIAKIEGDWCLSEIEKIIKDISEQARSRGYNRVLFKLENAGGTTGFSMILYLRDLKSQG